MSYFIKKPHKSASIQIAANNGSDESDIENSGYIDWTNVNRIECNPLLITRKQKHDETNGNGGDDSDESDQQLFNNHHLNNRNRNIQSKSVRQFLFVFGFATSLIILSQLYLVTFYDDPLAIVPGWDRNKTREIPRYILPNVNTTILEPTILCKGSEKILLLIVICSSPDNFEIRQTIRETWGNTSEFNYSKFSSIHSQFKGKYLDIDYSKWSNYSNENSFIIYKEINDENIDQAQDNETSKINRYDFEIQVVFLIGRTKDNDSLSSRIMNESRTHNDLIQEDFLDSYNNLTLKTIMMLKWANTNCENKVKFLMKCDDDTFVNVPNLIHFLLGGTIPIYNATFNMFNGETINVLSSKNRLNKYKNLLIGSRFCHSKPISSVSSKWFTPRYMYDKKTFPNYLSGSGYLMTFDTAAKLYNVSMEIPLLHLEDVFLTGICAEKAKIMPMNHHLFHYLSYKNLCEFRGMITIHGIKSNVMRRAYESIFDESITCEGIDRQYVKSRKLRNVPKQCTKN